MVYNQYTDKYTKNACSLVSILHIMLYMYGVRVNPDFIMKIAIFFDKLDLRSPSSGAIFSVIYKGFVKQLNRKLGLNFKVVTKQISTLSKKDKRTFGLGIKGYSSFKYKKIREDNTISKDDIDYLTTFKGGIGHNVVWDGDGGGMMVDTDGSKACNFSLDTLKYAQEKGIVRDNIRTIVPADEYTARICHFTKRLYIVDKGGDIEGYVETNKDNKYIQRAKELYLYGR